MKIIFDNPDVLLDKFYSQDEEKYNEQNTLWAELFKDSESLVIKYEDMDRYISISDSSKEFEIQTLIDDNDLGSFIYDTLCKPLFDS